MTFPDLSLDRLNNQQLVHPRFSRVEEVVGWLGAIQAQNYADAQWSVGLRLPGCRAADVEAAIIERKIILTWVLRGTLHLVTAADIRWMLALLAPLIIPKRESRYTQLGLDTKTFEACTRVLIHELQGGRRQTRKDLLTALEAADISTEGQRGYHLLGRAGLDGVICFGPKANRQQTFVLLNEWIPKFPEMDRHEALTELARRYVISHGPATLQDFIWWSGLPAADARSALAAAGPALHREMQGSGKYWQPESDPSSYAAEPTAFLLPAYDEYLIGYRDRSHAIDSGDAGKVNLINGLALPILINGRVRGTWKRKTGTKKIGLSLIFFNHPDEHDLPLVLAAAEQYGWFMGKPVDTT